MSFPGTLVSVVIPCYEQAHFLSEAIESVLAQTCPDHEIVVDDGSRDNTAEVAARYPGVRYIYQENQGTASARNKGLRESTGSYLVFLDADDRLLPEASSTALDCLNAHPECAFVFGLCQYIADDGSPLPITQPPYYEDDDYLAMLRGCWIGHPASIMCRRSVFDTVTGFNTSLVVSSDYDFYLRVTRGWPIYCHNKVISEYRQHSTNKSLNNARMLKYGTAILRSQWPFIRGNKRYEEAYRIGIRNIQNAYYKNSTRHLRAYLRTGDHREQALRNMLVILRCGPKLRSRSALLRLYGLILRMRIKWLGSLTRSKGSFLK